MNFGNQILINVVTLRKVKPLQKELKYYDSWISGRKSYHLGLRVNLKPFEIKNENCD